MATQAQLIAALTGRVSALETKVGELDMLIRNATKKVNPVGGANLGQYPTLKTNYTNPQVYSHYGVELLAGPALGTSFTLASLWTLPSGVTRDIPNKLITVNASNLVIDGIDFADYQLYWQTGSNLEVRNSKWLQGATAHQPVVLFGSGINFHHNTVDGNKRGEGWQNGTGWDAIIQLNVGNGPIAISNNWLKNSYSDCIQFPAFVGFVNTVAVNNNLFENIGYGSGADSPAAHPDFFQSWGSGVLAFSFVGNIMLQNETVQHNLFGGGTGPVSAQGVFLGELSDPPNTYSSVTITDNFVVIPAMTATISYIWCVDPSYVSGTMEIARNYVDIRGNTFAINNFTKRTPNGPYATVPNQHDNVVLNPAAGGGTGLSVWDATYKPVGMTISGAGLIVTHTGAAGNWLSQMSDLTATGLKCWELLIPVLTDTGTMGVAKLTFPNTGDPNVGGLGMFWTLSDGHAWVNGSHVGAAGPVVVAGDRWMIVINTATLNMYRTKDGVNFYGGSNTARTAADVLAGTDPLNPGLVGATPITNPVRPLVSLFGGVADSITANFGASAFVNTPPSGYTKI